MTEPSTPMLRSRRIRNALLASVFTIGIAGAAGTGALLTDSHVALAEPVRVEAAAPADFTTVVEMVTPAVVSVQVQTEVEAVVDRFEGFDGFEGFDDLPPGLEDFFRRFGTPPGFRDDDDNGRRPYQPRRGESQGSGFFISGDGYVVTNSHVVQDGREYTVVTQDGSELAAELIGTDDRTDLALLKVEPQDEEFTYVTFATEEAKVGQWVLAIGNPFGLGGSVSAGIISANGRDIGSGPYDNFLQIDAPVNRGNSGGPAFNTQGEVIGVNTAIFSPSGGNVGIAFAIPATMVMEVVDDLRDDGVVTRGWLGVQIQPVTEDIAESLGIDSTEGAIVADAMAEGPAMGAGVQAGDIITEVNGNAVADPKALSETIARIEPGQEVTITLMRDGREREVQVTLGNLNDFDERQQAEAADADEEDRSGNTRIGSLDALGLTIEDNAEGDGVVVVGVEDDSPASEKGLQAGDIIVGVGGQSVESVADVEEGISAAQDSGRDAVLFRVQGEGGNRFVGVPFERG